MCPCSLEALKQGSLSQARNTHALKRVRGAFRAQGSAGLYCTAIAVSALARGSCWEMWYLAGTVYLMSAVNMQTSFGTIGDMNPA